jgi:hypothetical protein
VLSLVSALNVAWAVICLTLGMRLFRSGSRITSAKLQRVVALLMAAVALFPVVSASDDLVRFAFLGCSAIHTDAKAGTPLSDDSDQQPAQAVLAKLLDSLDSVQVTPFCTSAFILVLIAFLVCAAPQVVGRRVTAVFGRAPPID